MRSRPPLRTTDDILAQFAFIRNKKQEYFICLSIDLSGCLIKRRTVTIGLVDRVQVHPRELFAGAIVDRAVAVIVAHNHTSGRAQPSKGDIAVTQQFVAAGILLGIKLVDHFIVTRDGHFSFRRNQYI